MQDREYVISLNGATDTYTEKEFNSDNIKGWLANNPQAQVYERLPYMADDTDIRDDDRFSISMNGSSDFYTPAEMGGENVKGWLANNPKAAVSKWRKYDYWKDQDVPADKDDATYVVDDNGKKKEITAAEYHANRAAYTPTDNRSVTRNSVDENGNPVVGDADYMAHVDHLRNMQQLQDFMAQNGEMLRDWEKEKKWEMSGTPDRVGQSFSEKYPGVTKQQMEEIQAEQARLVSQRNKNPYYQKLIHQDIDNANALLEEIYGMSKEEMDKAGQRSAVRMGGGLGSSFTAPAMNEYLRRQRSLSKNDRLAQNIANKAKKVLEAPTKDTDKENPFRNFLKGGEDTITDPAFWTDGISNIIENNGVKKSVDAIRKKLGGRELTIDDLDNPERIGDILSPDEVRLIKALGLKMNADFNRALDTSNMYRAGQTATESLKFMLEFIATGGVARSIEEGVGKGFGKWVANSMESMAARGASEASKLAARGGIRLAEAIVKPAASSFVRMWLMPSTYENMSDAMAYQMDYSTGHLKKGTIKDAIKSVPDSWVEVWSEQALEPMFDLASKTLGYAGKGKIGRWIKEQPLGNFAILAHDSGYAKFLRQAGFHGYLEEMLEEVLGAGTRQVLGIDDNAWEQFWDKEQLGQMAVAFLPMSLAGAFGVRANIKRANRNFEQERPYITDLLQRSGLTVSEATDMLNREAHTMDEIASNINEVVRKAKGSGNLTEEDKQHLISFAAAQAQKDLYESIQHMDFTEENKKVSDSIEESVGNKYWQGEAPAEGQPDLRQVETILYADGRRLFVTAKDENGYACVDEKGNRQFLSAEDLADQQAEGLIVSDETRPINDFLTDERQARVAIADQERQAQDAQQYLQAVQDKVEEEKSIPVMENGQQVGTLTVVETTPEGVIVANDEGAFANYTWQEVADMMGMPTQGPGSEAVEEAQDATEIRMMDVIADLNKMRGTRFDYNGASYNIAEVMEDLPEDDGTPAQTVTITTQQGNSVTLGNDEAIQLLNTLQAQEAALNTPAQEETTEVTEETPAAEQVEPEQPKAETNEIHIDEKGRKLYTQAPAEVSYQDIFSDENFETTDEALGFVSGKVKRAEEAAKKQQAKADKIKPENFDTPAEYRQAKDKANAELQPYLDELSYWQSVKALADADILANQKLEEAAARNRENRMREPQTLNEVVADAFIAAKNGLNKESFMKETGYGAEDMKPFFQLWAKKGQGMTVWEFAQFIADNDSTGLVHTDETGNKDVQAVRNAILEVFQSASKPADLYNYTYATNEAREEAINQQAEQAAAAAAEEQAAAAPAAEEVPTGTIDFNQPAEEQAQPVEEQPQAPAEETAPEVSFGETEVEKNPLGALTKEQQPVAEENTKQEPESAASVSETSSEEAPAPVEVEAETAQEEPAAEQPQEEPVNEQLIDKAAAAADKYHHADKNQEKIWQEWLNSKEEKPEYRQETEKYVRQKLEAKRELKAALRQMTPAELSEFHSLTLSKESLEAVKDAEKEIEENRREVRIAGIINRIQNVPQTKAKELGKFDPYKFVDTEAIRPAMTGVFHDDGYAVASSTTMLTADKGAYDKKKNGKIIDKDGKEITSQQYPAWRTILPDEKSQQRIPIDFGDLRDFLAGVRAEADAENKRLKAEGKKTRSKKDIGNRIITLNLGYDYSHSYKLSNLEKFADFAEHIGAKEILLTDERKAAMVKTNKGLALLMPVMADYDRTDADTEEGIAKELHDVYDRRAFGENGYQKQVAAETKAAQQAETTAKAEAYLEGKTPEQLAAEKEEARRAPIRARIADWNQRLGIDTQVFESRDDVKNTQVLSAIDNGEAPAGWYVPSTKTVNFYMPNITDEAHVDRLFMHEVVSHRGLRELLGEERFNELMDSVWKDLMTEEDHTKWLDYVSYMENASEQDKQRAAADEYVAHLAEDLDSAENATKWEQFVAKVREILQKIGIDLKLTEADLQTLLRASLANYEQRQADVRQKALAEQEKRQEAIAAIEGEKTKATDTAAAANNPQVAISGAQEKYDDFGQKIGMARKDIAVTPQKRGNADDRPAWMKKYDTMNVEMLTESQQDVMNRFGAAGRNFREVVDDITKGTNFEKPFVGFWVEEKKTYYGVRKIKHYITGENYQPIIFTSKDQYDATLPVFEAKEQKYRVGQKGNKWIIYRYASNKKAVEYAEFDTKEDAAAYLASPEGATSLLNRKRENFELPALTELTRVGMPDYRNGRNITPDDIMKTFGFRGGEFGNWLNADERQQFLNYAYDALMDLANILGVTPHALTLNGELSIAFGARGRQGAAAHYEPDRAVINLTKMNGAGSLAHEWGHALDNYFGLMDAKRTRIRERGKGIAQDWNLQYLSEGTSYNRGVRREVADAFKNVMNTLKTKEVTRVIELEKTQKEIDDYRKYADKQLGYYIDRYKAGRRTMKYNRKTKGYDETTYKLTDEQLDQLRTLAAQLDADKTFSWHYEMSKGGYRAHGDVAKKMYDLIAEVAPDRKENMGPLNDFFYYYSRVHNLLPRLEAAKNGETETVKVDTKVYEDSKWFDKDRAGSYYSSDKEMFARGIEAFVMATMREQGQTSDYLTYDKGSLYQHIWEHSPYAIWDELTPVKEAYRALFDAIQEKTDEETRNQVLFSKEDMDNSVSLPYDRNLGTTQREGGEEEEQMGMGSISSGRVDDGGRESRVYGQVPDMGVWGTRYHISPRTGSIPIEEVEALFHDFNTNPELDSLFEKVINLEKQYGIVDAYFVNPPRKDMSGGAAYNGAIIYSPRLLLEEDKHSEIPETITHELIHSFTIGAIELGKTPGKLLAEQQAAIDELNAIHEELKANPKKDNSIGKKNLDHYLSSTKELVAGMSDPKFRDYLRGIKSGDRTMWQRIVDAIKRLLGINKDAGTAFEVVDRALNELLDRFDINTYEATKDMEVSDEDGMGYAQNKLRTYHGTGADFERFDHSHMGEGEGNQAFGWGTYVAENPDVAKEYAIHYGAEGSRHLYTVNIPEDNGENYLHWDQPITNRQSLAIMAEVRKRLGDEAYDIWGDEFDRELMSVLGYGTYGSNVEGGLDYFLGNEYDYETDEDPGAKRNAELLNSVGIVGIEIPMGGARRSADKPGSDYVIFNENDLEIVDNIRFSKAGDVNSEKFKNWFGNSQVVDAAGNPLVVYHQTAIEFTVFDPKHGGAGKSDFLTPFGIFLKPNPNDIGLRGKIQMPLYASIQVPLTVDNRYELLDWLKAVVPGYNTMVTDWRLTDAEYKAKYEQADKEENEELMAIRQKWSDGEISEEEFHKQTDEILDGQRKVSNILDEWGRAGDELALDMKNTIGEYLRQNGYDGVHIKNDEGSFGRRVETWIALEPSQVKSATQNTGEYSPENPDIRFSKAQQAQKLPNKEYVDEVELDDIRFSLSKNNRRTIEAWFNKRKDLTAGERESVINYIDGIDNPTQQLAAARWFALGKIRLPEDMPKVEQAVDVAGKAKVDPLQYDSPMSLLDAHADFKPSEKRINPDEVPTLHKAYEVPEYGVVVYGVDEGGDSRVNMRNIINTHFGKDASPWCLLQGDGKGNLTDDSAYYWKHYNAYPKAVAFKDGKLLAFSANDREKIAWWDRQDEAHSGIPITMKMKNDELGRTATYELDSEGHLLNRQGIHRGSREPGGTYEEWYDNGVQMKEQTQYGQDGIIEEKEWYRNGQLGTHLFVKDDIAYTQRWNDKGVLQQKTQMKYGETTQVGEQLWWFDNGEPRAIENYDEDGLAHGLFESYTRRGDEYHLVSRAYYNHGKFDGVQEVFYSNGSKHYEYTFENGVEVGPYKEWHDNGQKKTEGQFVAGEKEGEWRYYDVDGEMWGKRIYHDGNMMQSERYLNNTISQRAHYDTSGQLHGNQDIFNKEGRLSERMVYDHGTRVKDSVFDNDGNETVLLSLSSTAPEDIRFSKRTKEDPKKTKGVYKLMRLGEDGRLYPLFIDSTEPLEIGQWYDADSPNLDMLKSMPEGVFLVDYNNGDYTSLRQYARENEFQAKKFPRKEDVEQAAADGLRWVYIEPTKGKQARYEGENRKYWNLGINGSGSVSTFAMRPGWHAGSLPTMRQIGKGANRNLRDDSFVWVKGSIPADVNYQQEADKNPGKDIPTHIPTDGYYLKATNADSKKSQADKVGWYVAGSFRPDRILSDSEARDIIDRWNAINFDSEPVEYDYPRESGRSFNAQTMQLEGGEDIRFSKQVAADLYDRYTNQDGEQKPWMSEDELIREVEEKLPYGMETERIFQLIDKYHRLDNEDFEEGRRDFSGGEKSEVFDQIVSALGEYGDADKTDIRFAKSNANQAIFVSNAQKAVEGIQMEKATPEQWLKMLENKGGLKAGEDKWLGLSDWLKESDKKSITKQEIQDFISENGIKIEETHYSQDVELDDVEALEQYNDEFNEIFAQMVEERRNSISPVNPALVANDAFNEMVNRYGDDFSLAFEYNGNPDGTYSLEPTSNFSDDLSDAAKYFLDQKHGAVENQRINSTRLHYTTDGLENKREIALTVPTIEPWNEDDPIHFGDAGEGRAISWIRFGDAYIPVENKKTLHVDEFGEPKKSAFNSNEIYYPLGEDFDRRRDYVVHGKTRNGDMRYGVYVNERLIDGNGYATLEEAKDAMNAYYEANPIVKKSSDNVLVIDEVQSKRHQTGRERGYRGEVPNLAMDEWRKYGEGYEDKWANVTNDKGESVGKIIYGPGDGGWYWGESNSGVPSKQSKDPEQALQDLAQMLSKKLVPQAPFEKNWPELSMKRMLRFAAENNYDHIAWTTGDQQAERYNIGGILNSIERREHNDLGERDYRLNINGRGNQDIITDDNGNVVRSIVADFRGKNLADIVGKNVAEKALQMKENESIEGEDFRVGGEGMRGFYDEIIPRFMNKYCKKWGVQTEDLFIPDIGISAMDDGMTMHSIKVTPEMKQSVMEGQVMFSKAEDTIEKEAEAAEETAEEAKQTLRDEIRSVGKRLAEYRKVAAAQRKYDRETVDAVAHLARRMMDEGLLTDLSALDVKRLLSSIRSSVGKAHLDAAVNRIVELVADNQLRRQKNALKDAMSTKATKVNQSGVQVQGALDVAGQTALKTFKTFMGNTIDDIESRIADTENRLTSEDTIDAARAAAELDGLKLAQLYSTTIDASIKEEYDLRQALQTARTEHRSGKMTDKAYREFVADTEDAIRENRSERIDAYDDMIQALREMISGSRERAAERAEAEKARVEQIHHFANSDMQGMPDDEHGNKNDRWTNNAIIRWLNGPLATFDQMLRAFGRKSVRGEGYLFNKFLRGWNEARDNEISGIRSAKKELDKKVQEVFGDKHMRWSDLYSKVRSMPTVKVNFWDGGEMKDHDLTQGNLLYIYMVNKMTDGRMKLRRMGITQEDVDAIVKQMDPKFIEIADWLQDSFLKDKRNKYNEVYERMFGAPMAAIENYFPLRINARSRVQEQDVAKDDVDAKPSTITGSIIKRVRNAQALDLLNSDAFAVTMDHIEEMEHWAAFAEYTKDLNTLLSYKHFRNQVENMSTLFYGAGNVIWRNFLNSAKIAVGKYKPVGKKSETDRNAVNIAKGVTTAKISFRLYTAIKQLLSFPAYLSDANIFNLAKNLAMPRASWKWSMENLPMFRERWESRMAGDSRLMNTDDDWKLWQKNAVKLASRLGLSPNAFVDAVTVAIGAKSMYETRKAAYLKDGYSEEKAEKKAKQDAEILYNETQQSTEGAFLSAMQLDRTWASTALTVFRNSSMGYQRQMLDAARNIGRRFGKGYKDASIEYMTKQMVRDGIPEDDARKASERLYNKALARDAVRVAIFGYVLQFAWNLGSYLPYLLFGDDDDKKEQMLKDAARHGLFGPVEGLSAGNAISEIGNIIARDGSIDKVQTSNLTLMPVASDMQRLLTLFKTDKVAAANELVNLGVQAIWGVNPQTFTDMIVAVIDACNGDLEASKEAMMLIMRIMNVPQSQLDQLYLDEVGMTAAEAKDKPVDELARRYAEYRVKRGAPLTGWAYSDEEKEKQIMKYEKQFSKKIKERKDLNRTPAEKAYDEWVEDVYKPVTKTLNQLEKDAKEANIKGDQMDFIEKAQRLNEFRQSEIYQQYALLKGRKKAIDKVSNKLEKVDTDSRIELEKMLLELKNEFAKELTKSKEK